MNEWVIGGVPEHFSLPWQDVVAARAAMSLAEKAETTKRRALSWRSFPEGTGAMVDALESGEIDLAVLLTEGAVAGLARGAAYAIVSNYVTSPLIWGVHVAPASGFFTVGDLASARFALSRFGSGSHLMALALAREHGWSLADTQLVVVDTLQGAIDAFRDGRADVFMWEHFMTQPVVDRGDFRRVGDFVAPWSSFVVCARSEIADRYAAELRGLIDDATTEAARFAADPATVKRLYDEFGIDAGQAVAWLEKTRWARGLEPPDADVAAAGRMLRQAGLVEGDAGG